MNKIILLGGGGHAKSCIDVIESLDKYKIIGIIDPHKSNKDFIYDVYTQNESLSDLRKTSEFGLVTVGQ